MNPVAPFPPDYRSPSIVPGWFSGSFPSLSFYPRMGAIVLHASRLSRRGVYDDEAWVGSSVATVRTLESVGVRFTVEGLGGFIGLGRPAVIIGNHMSTLETFSLPCILRPYGPMTFIVKRELVETPVFKHIMISRQPIVVGRSNPREDLRIVLEEGEARLKAGFSVVVFPQTTRAASWNPGEFNSIGVKLAKRAGAPVVPLALRTDAWGIGRRVKDMGWIRPQHPVRVSFGQPLTVTGSGREAQEAVIRFITEKVTAWGVPMVAPAGVAPPAE